jgi:hypothetical protein
MISPLSHFSRLQLTPRKFFVLPPNEIERRLSIAGFSAQDIRALLREDEWCALESRSQQVVFLYDFTKSKCPISLPAVIIRRVFGIHEAHVWKIRSKPQKTARLGHRTFELSYEQERAIITSIERGHSDGNFVTQRDLLNFVEFQFGKCLTSAWVH